jgi:hypothetical protein
MNKKQKYVTVCLAMLSCTATLNVYSLSGNALVSPAALVSDSAETTLLANGNDISSTPVKEERRLSGSNTPSKWVYSKNKSVACRIKQWHQGEYESYVDIEFSNVNSRKPVNMVYGLIATDQEGQINRGLFNAYKDEQYNITEFKLPLKKGQKRISQVHKKYSKTWSKLELKECRASKSNENFWTLNPEMRNYVGD